MSPKNKGKFGKGKPADIPETDEFISGVDRVVRALKPHALKLAVFFGVVTLIVVSYTVWQWLGHRKAAAATAAYARVVALGSVPVQDEAPEADPNRPPDPRDLPSHFKSRAERAQAILAAVEELDSEHGSTEVGEQADLIAADALFELGRHGEAAKRYREYLSHGGPDELIIAAREGLAYALEAQAMAEEQPAARQAGLEEALKAFEDMQPDASGVRRDEALYHQARLLAELGQVDQAVARYKQILTDHSNSALVEDIELRLLALESQPQK